MFKIFELCLKFIYHWSENELRMTGVYYRLKYYLPLLLLFIVFLGSCGIKKNILFQINPKTKIEIPDVGVFEIRKSNDPNLYKEIIKVGDRITINNLQNISLLNGIGGSLPISNEDGYFVDIDSTATIPFLGKVKLANLEINEAEKKIAQLLEINLLKNPIIKLEIIGKSVNLVGEFNKQGKQIIDGPTTSLIDIISAAEGLSNRANKKEILIIRGSENDPQILNVDLTKLDALKDPRINLLKGDIIYSKPRKFVMISDQISPYLTYISAGTILLNLIFIFR